MLTATKSVIPLAYLSTHGRSPPSQFATTLRILLHSISFNRYPLPRQWMKSLLFQIYLASRPLFLRSHRLTSVEQLVNVSSDRPPFQNSETGCLEVICLKATLAFQMHFLG